MISLHYIKETRGQKYYRYSITPKGAIVAQRFRRITDLYEGKFSEEEVLRTFETAHFLEVLLYIYSNLYVTRESIKNIAKYSKATRVVMNVLVELGLVEIFYCNPREHIVILTEKGKLVGCHASAILTLS